MKAGNWIPISKAFVRYLPKDRAYTELEAAYSLQVDYDQGNSVTVMGYADLWRWSRGKVTRFLINLGVKFQYSESTGKRQNQRGQIVIQMTDRKRTDCEQIRLIDSKDLRGAPNRRRTDDGQKTDRSRVTTKDPNPDPNKYSENSIEFSLAKRLFDLIISRNPKFKKPDLQQWAVHIDRAIRLDKRTSDELRNVIDWCQQNDFWQSNILSTAKLRKQFDQLWMKMNSEGASGSSSPKISGYPNFNTPEEIEAMNNAN